MTRRITRTDRPRPGDPLPSPSLLAIVPGFVLVAVAQGTLVWLTLWLLDRDGVTDVDLSWLAAARTSVLLHVVAVIAVALFHRD